MKSIIILKNREEKTKKKIEKNEEKTK